MYFETAAQNSKWYTYTSSANGWDSCWIASYIDALPNTDPAFNKVGSSSSGVFTFHWGNEMGKDTALNAASGTALGTLTKDGDGAVLNCQVRSCQLLEDIFADWSVFQRTVTNDMGTLPATTGACQILANVPGDGATPPAAITQGMLVAKCS